MNKHDELAELIEKLNRYAVDAGYAGIQEVVFKTQPVRGLPAWTGTSTGSCKITTDISERYDVK